METSSMCAQHVRQLFMSLDSPHTYHESFCQMAFWLDVQEMFTTPKCGKYDYRYDYICSP